MLVYWGHYYEEKFIGKIILRFKAEVYAVITVWQSLAGA